jgi:cephalosporin hydroxylase
MAAIMTIQTVTQLNDLIGQKPAYIHDDEIGVLNHYAQNAQTIVEIGAGYGGSAVIFLAASHDPAKVYSVDCFVPDSHGQWQASADQVMDSVVKATVGLRRLDLSLRYVLFEESSLNVARRWKKPIDVLYIDGDHEYQAVRADWAAWWPFVSKANGVVLLHDSRRLPDYDPVHFARGWPGPTRLAAELRGRPEVDLLQEVYSLTVWGVHHE